ncbi:hypothetical protein [Aurantimonas marianensis]|uniref:hypothetical protein n=1 Tax=Aurantimonas marianensis TaxID=2920428 RepID=UPI003C2D1CE8
MSESVHLTFSAYERHNGLERPSTPVLTSDVWSLGIVVDEPDIDIALKTLTFHRPQTDLSVGVARFVDGQRENSGK